VNAIRVVTPTRSARTTRAFGDRRQEVLAPSSRSSISPARGVCILSVIALLVGLRATPYIVLAFMRFSGSRRAKSLLLNGSTSLSKPWALPAHLRLVVLALPLAVGTFLGAPLIASELERAPFASLDPRHWKEALDDHQPLVTGDGDPRCHGHPRSALHMVVPALRRSRSDEGWMLCLRVTPVTLAAWAVLALSLACCGNGDKARRALRWLPP